MRLFLSRAQRRLFLWLSGGISLPFLVLASMGATAGERGLIFLFPFSLGMPWSWIFPALLPTIPGYNAPPLPGVEPDLVFEAVVMLLPVYLNIYLFVRIGLPVERTERGDAA